MPGNQVSPQEMPWTRRWQRASRQKKDVQAKKSEIERTEALVAARKKTVLAAEQAVGEILAGSPWGENWSEDTRIFIKDLEETARSYRKRVDLSESMGKKIEESRTLIGFVQGTVAVIVEMMPSWKGLEAGEAVNIPELSKEAESVKSALILERHKLALAEEHAKTESAKVDAFLEDHPEHDRAALKALSEYSEVVISEIERRHKKASDELAAAKVALATDQRNEAEHQLNKPSLSDGDTVERLEALYKMNDKAMSDAASEVALLTESLRQDEENREKVGRLKEIADNLRKEFLLWSRLNDLIDRYVLKVVPGTFVIEVEDAYQGYVTRPASTKSGRQVGIISHIEELQEKIPVRIEVNQNERTATSTVTVVP